MKTFLMLGTALGALALAGAANASVTISAAVANQLFTLNSGSMLDDFDGHVAAHVTFTGHTLSAPQNPVSNSAAPPYSGPGAVSICCETDGVTHYSADPTGYEAVQGGQTSTFSTDPGYYLTSFSFYMGSPDNYNHMIFNFSDGTSQQFDGEAIWGGTPQGTGDRTEGFRVYYDFGGAKVSSIQFKSDSSAFEADNFAGDVGIPEPATWALMLTGFGAAGSMLRRRKAVLA